MAALSLCVCMPAAAGRKKKTKNKAEIAAETTDANTSRRLSYFFIEAVRRQQKGEYDAAFDLLRHCNGINPDAAEVYFALAPYYSAVGDDGMALACMMIAADMRPDNATYIERLAEACINMQQYDEAIVNYEKLYETNRERTDVLNILLQLYGGKADYDNMIRTIDRVEVVEGSNERIALARMRVYSLQGMKEKELDELVRLTAKHPDDMNYRVMKGNWLLQNDRPDEAYDEYMYVLEQEPENMSARMSLIDYYTYMGETHLSDSLKECLLVSADTPVKTKTSMLVKYVGSHAADTVGIVDLFRRIIAVPQKSSAMHELYASYMSLIQMPEDSVYDMLGKALEIEPDNAGVRLQMIRLRWQADDYDAVIALCEPATKFNPDEMVFYYFYGMAYFMQDNKDEALRTFQLGVSQINEESDKDIVSDFYAIMGDILYERDRSAEAFAAYDSSLQWKPDNISCLNNYAYYLSILGRDLQKAEKMSIITIRTEPSNSTYLDTYAWIMFCQERYDEAKAYIDRAVACDTTRSAVIIEHAGDIYAVSGDIDTAMDYWRQAQDAGSDSAVLPKKIKQRRYIKDE